MLARIGIYGSTENVKGIYGVSTDHPPQVKVECVNYHSSLCCPRETLWGICYTYPRALHHPFALARDL